MKSSSYKNWGILIARLLLSAIFLMGAYNKLTGIEGTASYIASVDLPYPTLLAWLGGLIELVGGLGLLLGIFTRWSALLLAIYLTVVTFAFHYDFSDQNQITQFLKNAAIIGGLLMAKLCGGGGMCVVKDACCKNGDCQCK